MPKIPCLTVLRKSHARLAWMAGATAAASPAAHAATAQITLVNDFASINLGNHLSFDITAGHSFGSVTLGGVFSSSVGLVGKIGNSHKRFSMHAGHATSLNRVGIGFNLTQSVAHSSTTNATHRTQAFELIPIKITDPNVAGGQTDTNVLLELEAFLPSQTDATVAMLALFYPTGGNTPPGLTINSVTGAIAGSYTNAGSSDNGVFTPAAAPEPSGLALLALGAGGILARRQRRKTA